MFIILSLLALVSAALCIRADYAGERQQVYVFKPLTMIFITAIALLEESTISDTYKIFIIVGLLFSVMGDVWLMLPDDRFVQGLVSFLIAHIFYIAAFSSVGDHIASLLVLIPLGAVAGSMFWYLRPALGKYLMPVLAYLLVILVMGWQSFNRLDVEAGELAAVVGALLFMLSDSLLAINRFRQHFHLAQLLILSTYFAAQWFIAQSI
ncbi:MAG: lysoplasmalogenase [Chloroflexi bacterium]|nr:lysoplasmalogenase [Chloroflexota bacterium]